MDIKGQKRQVIGILGTLNMSMLLQPVQRALVVPVGTLDAYTEYLLPYLGTQLPRDTENKARKKNTFLLALALAHFTSLTDTYHVYSVDTYLLYPSRVARNYLTSTQPYSSLSLYFPPCIKAKRQKARARTSATRKAAVGGQVGTMLPNRIYVTVLQKFYWEGMYAYIYHMQVGGGWSGVAQSWIQLRWVHWNSRSALFWGV